MVIYNKRVMDNPPTVIPRKTIKPTIDDVLLTFTFSEQKGNTINIHYSISYFNIPANIPEFKLSSYIDMKSLENVVRETVDSFDDKFLTVASLTSKEVVFSFDVKSFLIKATFPTNIARKKDFNKIYLKLNRKVPAFVKQTSEEIITTMFSDVMTSLIRKTPKYKNIFSSIKSWYYSRSSIVNATYDLQSNMFYIELQNPFRNYYYFYNKKSNL